MNEYRWEELHVGLRHEFDVTLTDEMLGTFRALSGDTNPLHGDREFAVRAGFPGAVAFGLLTSAFYSQLVGVYLPGKYALLQGVDVDFVTPAFAGDRLRVSGEVSYLTDAYKQIQLRAKIVNQNDKVVSKAKIRVGLNAP
jgi:3-hydroxybutyryl-CoA dehydratase